MHAFIMSFQTRIEIIIFKNIVIERKILIKELKKYLI